jgi:hypothetical protein
MSRTRRYKVAHMSMTMWSRSAREGYTGAGTRRKKRHLGGRRCECQRYSSVGDTHRGKKNWNSAPEFQVWI